MGASVLLLDGLLRGLKARKGAAGQGQSGSGSPGWSRHLNHWLLVLALSLGGGFAPVAQAKGPYPEAVTLEAVALAALPPEARTTHRLIHAGGPFPYAKDGTVFGNREKLLPRRPRGHYREYTVKTPGLSHRGARRIVCDGLPPESPKVCFYTDDHYSSFRRIVQ
jgi:ribonuclease T1